MQKQGEFKQRVSGFKQLQDLAAQGAIKGLRFITSNGSAGISKKSERPGFGMTKPVLLFDDFWDDFSKVVWGSVATEESIDSTPRQVADIACNPLFLTAQSHVHAGPCRTVSTAVVRGPRSRRVIHDVFRHSSSSSAEAGSCVSSYWL